MSESWLPSESSANSASSERIVWSTERVQSLIVALDEGYKPKGGTPFYDGNPNLRKGNAVFEYTDNEVEEIRKCARDIVYFANNYATVMTDKGLQTIVLRDYQEEMLRCYVDNRFSIVLASRQIGKTICSSIFIAWYLLFNIDKTALILANKGATTKEIIDKAKVILENVPFFLKPGILKYDVMNMKFDNGCRMVGQSTTGKAGIGFTIHLLFLDEFAHIHHTFVDSFYENVYPTLSSSAVSRIIITSTPNGFNKFYEIYASADAGLNEFSAFKVDWWQVPGRDEAWKEQEINNLGGEEAFNRQYGNQFMATSSLLLEATTVKRLQKQKKDFVHHDFEEFDNIQYDTEKTLRWAPDFETEDIKDTDKFWLFSVDIAEGNGGDYSVINMFEVIPMETKHMELVTAPGALYDFFKLKQIAVFSDNEASIEDFAKVLYTLGFDLFYGENVKMVIEWNTYGAALIKYLQTIFPQRNEFDEETIVKFKHRHDAKKLNYGLKIKKDNKAIFCQNFKKYIEHRRFEALDEGTVKEISTFGTLPSGSYGGQMGNDDLAMTCINATEFMNTVDYADYVEELLDRIDPGIHKKMEDVLYKDKDLGEGNLHYDIYDLL
tara:strand:+ start:7109 stop:8929 length:1821 start_codon:yes stop_codon:yes gene_type:complete